MIRVVRFKRWWGARSKGLLEFKIEYEDRKGSIGIREEGGEEGQLKEQESFSELIINEF
jgi:hypothetical protein